MIDVEGSVRAVSLDEAQARHDSLFLITCQIVKAAGGRVNIPVHARSVLNPTLTVSQLSDGSLEVTVRDVK